MGLEKYAEVITGILFREGKKKKKKEVRERDKGK